MGINYSHNITHKVFTFLQTASTFSVVLISGKELSKKESQRTPAMVFEN